MKRAFVVLAFAALAASEVAEHSLKSTPRKVIHHINEGQIRAHDKFLSSPKCEGRLAGSRGEKVAAEYAARQLKMAGIEPFGDNNTFFQSLQLNKIEPNATGPLTITSTDGSVKYAFEWNKDYVGMSQYPNQEISLDDEIVFVGYGVVSTTKNDYSALSVKGKVVLVLSGTPTGLQGWSTTASYAYAYGAKATVIINIGYKSGYSFESMKGTYGSKMITPYWYSTTKPAYFVGWLSDTSANLMIQALEGKNLSQWQTEATPATFKARKVGTVKMTANFVSSTVYGTTVAGILWGKEAPTNLVVVSAHIDHLGKVEGKYYPGANDNGLGISTVLSIGQALGWGRQKHILQQPNRSIVLLLSTAEEWGLYGASYFLRKIKAEGKYTVIADINYDTGNVWGKTKDVMVFGRRETTLGTTAIDFGGAQIGVTPDDGNMSSAVYKSYMGRADHAAFYYSYGIPAIWIHNGNEFPGKEHYTDDWCQSEWFQTNIFEVPLGPTFYGECVWYKYYYNQYHHRNDQFNKLYDPNAKKQYYSWPSLAGQVQMAQIGLTTAYAVAGGNWTASKL